MWSFHQAWIPSHFITKQPRVRGLRKPCPTAIGAFAWVASARYKVYCGVWSNTILRIKQTVLRRETRLNHDMVWYEAALGGTREGEFL
jgi:hypothetical protein